MGLIVTADDFGLHPSINDAVEIAHRQGILSAASLMVGAPHFDHAVQVARRNPELRVGLHLVLADGYSVLPHSVIPDLVDASGNFPADAMVRDGFRFCYMPSVRKQLAAEIRAQFEAFEASGLHLDHANAHKHFHLHPTILSLMLGIGAEFGLHAVRVPAAEDASVLIRFWAGLLRHRLRRAGMAFNDHLAGLTHSGKMDEKQVLNALTTLKAGVTEIYLHPATISGSEIRESMADYAHASELSALCAPSVRKALQVAEIQLGGYSDIYPVREEM